MYVQKKTSRSRFVIAATNMASMEGQIMPLQVLSGRSGHRDRQIKESDSTGTERTKTRQADTLSLQEDSIIRHPSHSIYGEWFTPHVAQFCIIFRQDSTFVFRLFNDDGSDASGYFTIKKKKVTLHFEDGRKLVLNYSNPWDDDQSGQWYLWKGKLRRFQYYLVKAYTETNDKQSVRHSNESSTVSNG